MVEKIDDAVRLEKKLEEDIFELVQEYEKQTMLSVQHVFLRTEENERDQERAISCNITTKLQ